MVPMVQEFYASLQDQEPRNTEGHIWDIVSVRGKEFYCMQYCRKADMFRPTEMEQEEEVHESKEDEDREDEEDDESEEMGFEEDD
ncbi:hypothetical protein J1N35_025671 [Gossypium stocksii]|uniref:Uncharacterized protein n=1 Tax=Gossypium stocksii TaxID=47602 RepID=A0A9D3V820_9ROSI|nr:hypothetical protein J1N35_025671 [Gossypium stocksii]